MLENLALPAIIEHLEPVFCCCRKTNCDAVLSSRRVMQQLELDLRTAAEIGQRILHQHDDYVRQAEADKVQLLDEVKRQTAFAQLVDELEFNNRELEDRNLRAMRENAELLRRLEDLNSSLVAADHRNQELRSCLNDTEKEVSKLSYEAVQAKGLDSQILMVELEREGLTKELEDLARDNRVSDTRYRKAEQHIKDLQEQLDQVLTVEAEQLKYSGASRHDSQSSRISDLHSQIDNARKFESTKDTLADMDAEMLRRSLAESRNEIEALQEQLRLHQHESVQAIAVEEQRNVARKSMSQELHQHHHYHYHVPAQLSGVELDSHMILSKDAHKDESKILEYTAFSSSDTPLSTFASHVETSTPIRQFQKSGLCSPPSSRRQHRDSGYFSFASEMTRDLSTSFTRPSTPNILEQEDITDSIQHSRTRHIRSSSHESVFAPADLSYDKAVTTTETLLHRKSLNCLASELACTTEDLHDSRQLPASTLSAVQQAPSLQAQSLLHRLQSSRRPYPSPLQGKASSPVVSTSTTSATTQSSTRQDVIVLPSVQVNRSYNALRSAAAAQRLSPNINGPQITTSSSFWRQNSDKTVPSNARSRSAKWADFVGWSSKAPPATTGKGATSKLESKTHVQTHGDSTGQTTGTSVQLSIADEDLLREALA